MTTEGSSLQSYPLLRLRVAAEADAQVFSCVLGRFQNLGILPRRVLAEFSAPDGVYIEVDIVGITEERLSLIAAKIAECPAILRSHWHYA